ncbi:MAG: hypothetical protein M9958_11085 [Chitinophagales bacterium]|nr:hypothetical protein [Chitinophagales bacterium]
MLLLKGLMEQLRTNTLSIGNIPILNPEKEKTKKAVNHYNKSRLHLGSVNNEYSPWSLKKLVLDLDNQERPKVIIYAEGNYKVKVASSHLNFKPRKEPKAHNCPMVIIDK